MSGFDDSSYGSGGSVGGLQEALIQEQQRAVIQTAIARLTEIAFDKCIGNPGSSLSGREKDCVQKITERYVDSSVFVLNRLTKQ